MPLKSKMLGDCKNEHALRVNLEQWRNLANDNDKKIIHTVRTESFYSSELSKKPAEEAFKNWDVISCSLISVRKAIKAARDEDHDLRSWESVEINTGLFFDIGLILSVPPQNILGTHTNDVWFPNHAGQNTGNTAALADAIFSGKGKPAGKHAWPANAGHTYNHIRSPQDVLSRTSMNRHNEILVIGKDNINIYPGYPTTTNIRVTGLIFAQKSRTGHGLFARGQHDELQKIFRTLKKLNSYTRGGLGKKTEKKLELIEI